MTLVQIINTVLNIKENVELVLFELDPIKSVMIWSEPFQNSALMLSPDTNVILCGLWCLI